MEAGSNAAPIRTIAVCLLGAALLAILPDSTTNRLRDLVRAALQPGQRSVLAIRDYAEQQVSRVQSDELADREAAVQELAARVRTAEFLARQHALTVQALQRQLEETRRHGGSRFRTQTEAPLLSLRAIDAHVIGQEILAGINARRLLDDGRADGIRQDQWVLDGDGPVIGFGHDLAVSAGLPVYAGCCVVGRIAQAGQHTSSIQLITASDFRERAVVANSRGFLTQSSPSGLLEGTGTGCRLTQVPATHDIQVGDLVYSVPGFPVDAPMLFGVVTSRTLQPGALHWDIEVEPHADLANLRTVQIVTPQLNPNRLASRN